MSDLSGGRELYKMYQSAMEKRDIETGPFDDLEHEEQQGWQDLADALDAAQNESRLNAIQLDQESRL